MTVHTPYKEKASIQLLRLQQKTRFLSKFEIKQTIGILKSKGFKIILNE